MNDIKISSNEVARIAKLARLNIDASNLELYAEQLQQILQYVGKVNEVSRRGDKEKLDVSPQHKLKNILRDDEVVSFADKNNDLMANVPTQELNSIKVPNVLGENL